MSARTLRQERLRAVTALVALVLGVAFVVALISAGRALAIGGAL